jgi:hypothetical protein
VGNLIVYLYGNKQCINVLKALMLCRQVTNQPDAPLNGNIVIKDASRDSAISERDSENSIFRDSINHYTLDDCEIIDDNGNPIDLDNCNCDHLDEEQLVRHIAILHKNEQFNQSNNNDKGLEMT